MAVAGLLPDDAGTVELFGLVIPGMTLQLLDPATQAVQHSGVGFTLCPVRLVATEPQPTPS